MRDVYSSVSHLMRIESRHVRIHWQANLRSQLAIVAPHAGRIEPVTGELAVAIAGDDHRLYCFSGRDRNNNGRLHVTSTRFADPFLAEVLRGALAVVSVHGSRGPSVAITQIGGTNQLLSFGIHRSLANAGFSVTRARPPMAGRHPDNVTNRAPQGGVQLEISRVLRDQLQFDRHAAAGEHGNECSCRFCDYVGALRDALARYESQALRGARNWPSTR